MPTAPSSEIVKTVVEAKLPTAPTPDNILVARAERDRVKREGVRTVTEDLAARKEKVDEKAAEKTIKENIGKEEIDKATGDKTRDAAEQARFDAAIAANNLIVKFLKEGKGLSGLDATEQEKVIDQVRGRMDEWDKIGGFFSGKTPEQQAELVRQWVEDPAFFNKVKDLHMARVVNPTEKIGGEGQEKENQIKEFEQQIEAKTKEVETNQEQQKEQYGIMESFEDHSAAGGKQGENHIRLGEIDTELKTYTSTRLQTLRREKGQLESRVTAITNAITAENSAKKPDAPALGHLRGELVQAQKDLEDRSGQLTDYENLKTEKDDLLQQQKTATARYKELTEEHIQKTDEINNAQKEIFALKAEQGMIGADRAEAEEAFVKSLQEIYGDALDELLEEQVRALDAVVQAAYKREIENPDTNPDRAALLAGLRSRYQKVEGALREHGRLHTGIGKGDVKIVVDKDKIGKDLDILKNNSNPEENLVRKVLEGTINPETKKPYIETEINAIVNGTDFVKNNIGDITTALIANGLKTRQVSAKDINSFVERGYVSEAKMIEVISESQKDKLKHAGITEKVGNELKKNKKLAWWLLLFMMFPVGGVAVTAFVAGKHVLGKEGGGHGAAAPTEHKEEPKEELPAAPEPKVEIDPGLLESTAKAA